MERTQSPPAQSAPDQRPLPAIAYYDDFEANAVRPWSSLVRWVGIIGLMLAAGEVLIIILLYLLPRLGVRPPGNIGVGQIGSGLERVLTVIRWLTSATLLAGSIACLARARFARAMMLIYAVASLVLVGLGFLSILLSPGNSGLTVYWVISILRAMAFPALVLAVVLQAPVRQLFKSR